MPSYRVLIVEDQREVSRLLRSALDTLETKLQVLEAPSGEDALVADSRQPADLLVADYRLPGMSGIELMRKLRKDRPAVKVILITGQASPQIRKEVAEAGADAFFLKPVPIADFLDAVERHLGLVETLLPPEPIAPMEEEKSGKVRSGLPDHLAHLRQELGAMAVLLLDDAGRVLARAGDLPDGWDEASLLSSLLSIYRANQKLSPLTGGEPASGWHLFDGRKYGMIFAPVGEAHAMLMIGKGLIEEGGLLKAKTAFRTARAAIEPTLEEIPAAAVPPSEPSEAPSDVPPQSDEELDPLLKATKKLESTEVNDFWEQAIQDQNAPAKPDTLSYDQAKQMGLTPEDDEA